MKKWLSVVAVVVLCLSLVIGVACGGGDGDGNGNGDGDGDGVTEIKLGMALPLSGILGALVGAPAKQLHEMAVEKLGVFEVGGKQYRWKLIVEDNEGASAAGGLATTTKFIYDDDVDIVFQSGVAAMTAQTLCEESGVILEMGTATFEAFGPDHPYSIQSGPCVAVQVAAFYDWLAEEHPEVKRIVVVAVDDPLMIAFAEPYESNMHEYFGFELEIVWTTVGAEYYPVATNVMTLDADLVIASASILDVMWDMGYEGLAVQYGAIGDTVLFEDAGWDDCKGLIFFYSERYGAEELWPEAVAWAREFEDRYGIEMGSGAFAGHVIIPTLTRVLQEAGSVDDTEKIIEVIHSRTVFDSTVGPVYYGGEAFVGVNCLLMWPVGIWEIVGEREYRVLDYYTAEEAEAIAAEAWTATMP
jgi:ABC-type branched-subunit amino acid transport system substrate-binding protein